jgi:biotin-(acetyl-CoA carboxylase) ligase
VRAGGAALDDYLEQPAELVDVADAVVRGLEKYLSHPEPVLTPALLDEVDRHDWLRDRRVLLTSPSADEGEAHATSGVCVGIAPDGALLFRPDRGALRRVQAGTVTAE